MNLTEVQVFHRTGQWCPGVRADNGVIAYDMAILPRWQVPGHPTTDRAFVLPAEGVQVRRPNNFSGTLDGGWYIDLIALEEAEPGRLIVHDLHADIVVPPSGRRYEVLDLDELADALERGSIATATAIRVLRDARAFIDGHMRILPPDESADWPDFPPKAIAELTGLPRFTA